MNYDVSTFIRNHELFIISLSLVTILVLIGLFTHTIYQLGKEENRLPEKRNKILNYLLFYGISLALLGSITMLSGIHPAYIR